jgi:hypothetical protein
MARYTNLADILRNAGLRVVETPGWRTRGAEMGDIRAIMLHHTASRQGGSNAPTLDTVTKGRGGKNAVPGPLSQFVLGRDGTWYVVASGLANHAGKGSGWGLPTDNANRYTLGIEAESSGVGSDWTKEQLESYPRGVAALCRAFDLAWHRVLAHKEWAPSRKVDPAGWPGDIDGFRTQVRAWMNGAGIVALTDEDVNRIATATFVKTMDEWLAREVGGPTTLSRVTTDNSENFLRLAQLIALVQELHEKLDTSIRGVEQVSEAVERLEARA